MFKERTYKYFLFWLKVKRSFLVLLFTSCGSIIGGLLSSYLIDVLMFYNFSKEAIVVAFTVVSFILSLCITTNIEKAIQDGYLQLATLRKLTLISKKLDKLDDIEKLLNHNPDYTQLSFDDILEDSSIRNTDINNDPSTSVEDNISIFDESFTNTPIEENQSIDDDNQMPEKIDINTVNEEITQNVERISKTIAIITNNYDKDSGVITFTESTVEVQVPKEELEESKDSVDNEINP